MCSARAHILHEEEALQEALRYARYSYSARSRAHSSTKCDAPVVHRAVHLVPPHRLTSCNPSHPLPFFILRGGNTGAQEADVGSRGKAADYEHDADDAAHTPRARGLLREAEERKPFAQNAVAQDDPESQRPGQEIERQRVQICACCVSALLQLAQLFAEFA